MFGVGMRVGWVVGIKGCVVEIKECVVEIKEKKNEDEFDEIGSWNEENFEELNEEKMESVLRRGGGSLGGLSGEVKWQIFEKGGKDWGYA